MFDELAKRSKLMQHIQAQQAVHGAFRGQVMVDKLKATQLKAQAPEHRHPAQRATTSSSSWVGQDDDKVHHDHSQEHRVGQEFTRHPLALSAASDRPHIDHQGEDARNDVKRDEGHQTLSASFANLIETVKNTAVIARPPASVSQGIFPASDGTKTPTTSDPKIILAPSRKKSERIFTSTTGERIADTIELPAGLVKRFLHIRDAWVGDCLLTEGC